MQQSSTQDQQTLPAAAQQQNAAQDRLLYIEGRHELDASLHQAGLRIRQAYAALDKAYENATPEQKKGLERLEHPLHGAQGEVHLARGMSMEVSMVPSPKLSQDGKSQFNAASQGDLRSVEPQIAKQYEALKKPVPHTISASPELAKDTPLERQRGVAKQEFQRQHDAQEPAESPQRESEQVKNSKPQPELKPSPELGGGVDAQTHRNAKTEDHQASLQATKHSQAAKNGAAQEAITITPEMREHYGKISQQLDSMQAGQSQSPSVNQSTGMKQ